MQNKDIPNIPIIACTAHALDEDIEKCKQYGMTKNLIKPIKPFLLDKILKDLRV